MTNAAYGQKLFSENAKGPSQYYKWWWPCWEGEGTDVIDHHCDETSDECVVQNANVDTGNTGAWNNPNDGWIVSDDGVAQGSAIQVDPEDLAHLDTALGETWIFAHWYQSPGPLNTHYGCSNNPAAGVPGWRITHNNGSGQMALEFGDGATSVNPNLAIVAADTPTHIMLVLDNALRKIHAYQDGVPVIGDLDYPDPFVDFDLSENLYGLAYGAQNANSTARAGMFRDIHHLTLPRVPLNLASIVRRLYERQYVLLTDQEIVL